MSANPLKRLLPLTALLVAASCASPAPQPAAANKPPPAPSMSKSKPTAADLEDSLDESPAEFPPPPAESAPEPSQPDAAPRQPGWLGVALRAREGNEPGVLVAQVLSGSPAEAAQLQNGDVILKVNGQAVNDWRKVPSLVSATGAGNRVHLVILRGTEQHIVAAELVLRPDRQTLVRRELLDKPAPPFGAIRAVRGSLTPTPKTLRGKVVLIDFWASWCMPCRAVVPILNDWYARYHAQGLEIVSVTTDPVSTAAQDSQTLGVTYPVFSDEDTLTSRDYFANSLPSLYLVDKRGVMRHLIVGVDTQSINELEHKLVELLDEPYKP